MDERLQQVLRTTETLGKLDRWGDGASDLEIQQLLEMGLLRFQDAHEGNPRYQLTSMGAQAARKARFAARKNR